MLEELKDRLIRKGIHLVVAPSVRKHIIKKGHDEVFGARPLRRALQEELEHEIADGILSGRFEKGTVLRARTQKGKVIVDAEREAAD